MGGCRSPPASQRHTQEVGLEQTWGAVVARGVAGGDYTWILCPVLDVSSSPLCSVLLPMNGEPSCHVCPRRVVRTAGGDSSKWGGHASSVVWLQAAQGWAGHPREVGELGMHTGVWGTHAGCCSSPPFYSQL